MPTPQAPPLAEAAFGHAPHQHAARGCGHHFRRSASRVTSFSSSDSASSFFSRVFGLEFLQALGVGDLMPPNLLRHR